MPSKKRFAVNDRCNKNSTGFQQQHHDALFALAKSQKYYYFFLPAMDLFMAGFIILAMFRLDRRNFENKTHSKIKDFEHGPCRAKLESITINFILGQGRLYLLVTEFEIMLEF